jgi:hypothetical protein
MLTDSDNGRMAKLRSVKARIALLAALLCVLGAVLWLYRRDWFPDTPPPPRAVEKDVLTVFLPTAEGRLVRRSVEAQRGLTDRQKAQEILGELQRNGVLSDKTALLDVIAATDGTIYVNLSKSLVEERLPPLREVAAVYAMVNSFLSTLREGRKVHFLVDGKAVYTLFGTVYTYEALEFNKYLTEE